MDDSEYSPVPHRGRRHSHDYSRPPSSSIAARPRSSIHAASTLLAGTGTGPSTKYFLVSVTGRIESAKIFGVNNVYCKYNFVYGPDWQITAVRIFQLNLLYAS